MHDTEEDMKNGGITGYASPTIILHRMKSCATAEGRTHNVRGWWQYYHLAQWRRPLDSLQGWLRRHMRKFFWLRWHNWRGRQKALSRLGIRSPQLRTAWSRRGAWRIAASPTLHMALDNARLCREGFLTPSDLAKENA